MNIYDVVKCVVCFDITFQCWFSLSLKFFCFVSSLIDFAIEMF